MSNMIAYEQLTVSSTSVGFTEGTVTHRAKMAIVQVRVAPVRYRGDGTAPTSSTGLSLPPGERLILVGEGTILNARFIREGSTNATVEGAFFNAVDAVQMIPSPSGEIAHDAVETGVLALPLSGHAVTAEPTAVAAADRVRAFFDVNGRLVVSFGVPGAGDALEPTSTTPKSEANATARALAVIPYVLAPDATADRLRSPGDVAPALGALNVAHISGNRDLRSSAVIGEASGTGTVLSNMSWVKHLTAFLDVTVVPTGGTPTLDVYIQTLVAGTTWQDIIHFTQVAGSVTKELVVWGPVNGEAVGTQAESAAVTVDHYFAIQDAALAATTIRLMPLGVSLRVKWVFAAGGSTGDYTFGIISNFSN